MKELLIKIEKVAEACMNIEKDMQVGNGNYTYKAVSDNSVTLKVKKAEKEFGIISIPIKQELIRSEIVKTLKSDGKEGITYVDVIKMTLRIFDIETYKYIDVESFGRGLDTGDKGFGKASTYARKYALLNAYKIATGEDPDSEPSRKGETKTSNQKHDDVKDYLLKNNAYCVKILAHFNVEDVNGLDSTMLDSIYKQLNTKKLL